MRARGVMAFDDGGEKPSLSSIDLTVDGEKVSATIGPSGAPGITVESEDRRVRYHYARLDEARRAADYRNSPPPAPMFKDRKRRKSAPAIGPVWEEEPEITITVNE